MAPSKVALAKIDEEKLKKRAERFGIKPEEKKPFKTNQKNQKNQKNNQNNNQKGNKKSNNGEKQQKQPQVVDEAMKKRIERFGVISNVAKTEEKVKLSQEEVKLFIKLLLKFII